MATELVDEAIGFGIVTAHRAVDADRVSTFLKIDDKRTIEQEAREKVESVEDHLGRPARSE